MSKTTTTMPYFKFDSGRFLAETMGWSSAAVGIYARLMALYWESGCRLPGKDDLKRKLGVTTRKETQLFEEVVTAFFPDGLHPHLDLCLYEAKGKSNQQSKNATKGWEIRRAREAASENPIPEDDPDF